LNIKPDSWQELRAKSQSHDSHYFSLKNSGPYRTEMCRAMAVLLDATHLWVANTVVLLSTSTCTTRFAASYLKRCDEDPRANSAHLIPGRVVIINFAQRSTPEVVSRGMRMADGTFVIPEVELVDERGDVFTLKAMAFRANSIGFSSVEGLLNER